MISILVSALICISPVASKRDSNVLVVEASRRGYSAQIGFSNDCDLFVVSGEEDVLSRDASILEYDSSRKVGKGRASDLFLAWETLRAYNTL